MKVKIKPGEYFVLNMEDLGLNIPYGGKVASAINFISKVVEFFIFFVLGVSCIAMMLPFVLKLFGVS